MRAKRRGPRDGARVNLRQLVPSSLRPSALFHRVAKAETSLRIAGGPFRGVHYAERAVWGAYVPKLTGTYERELHHAVEELIAAKPRTLVDIGGAEGYYAIGLLSRLPDARMVVYEQLAEGRAAISQLANKNAVVSRLDLRETCTPAAITQLAASTPIDGLIIDVEGAEWDLLTPEVIASLRNARLLIETHDFNRAGVTEHLSRLIEPSHHVTRLEQQPRSAGEFPWLAPLVATLPRVVEKYALNEFRPPENRWLWCVPR